MSNRFMVVSPEDCVFQIDFNDSEEIRNQFMKNVVDHYGAKSPLTHSVFNVIQQMITNPMITETNLIDGTIILRRKDVQVLIDEALKGK